LASQAPGKLGQIFGLLIMVTLYKLMTLRYKASYQ